MRGKVSVQTVFGVLTVNLGTKVGWLPRHRSKTGIPGTLVPGRVLPLKLLVESRNY